MTDWETKADRSRGPPEDTHPNRTEELGLPIQATCPLCAAGKHTGGHMPNHEGEGAAMGGPMPAQDSPSSPSR